MGRGESPPQSQTSPSKICREPGIKLESVGLGQGGFLRGSSTSWGAPEWQPKGWGGRIGPGDPKKTPRRGGGLPGACPWCCPPAQGSG